jgi:hypothetical protein
MQGQHVVAFSWLGWFVISLSQFSMETSGGMVIVN